MNKHLILLLLFLALGINVHAQQKKDTYILHLTNGSSLIGVLEHYALDQPAVLRLTDGETISVPFNSIESMEMVTGKINRRSIERAKIPYAFKAKGWHFAGDVGLISGGNNFNNPGLGFTLNLGATYHLNRLLGIGIRTGIDSYNSSIKQDFIPLYFTVDGYLSPTKTSVFYSFGLGYGFALKSEEFFGENGPETKGGIFFYPKIGVRLSGNDGVNMTLFSGIKFQDSEFEYQFCGFAPCEEFVRQERTFQRIVFGVGFVF